METISRVVSRWSPQSQRLREFRESKTSMSQEQFARAIGEKLRTYGTYERGESPLPLPKACQIADFYGCTVDEIAGREIGALSLGDDRLAELIADYLTLGEIEKTTVVAAVHGIAAEAAKREPLEGDRVIFP